MYMTQCSGWLVGASTWFSQHSTMKSTSAYDLMAVLGPLELVVELEQFEEG
jgi:hypothetical protein